MDTNRGPLVSEATALPTEPHNHCPGLNILWCGWGSKQVSTVSCDVTYNIQSDLYFGIK